MEEAQGFSISNFVIALTNFLDLLYLVVFMLFGYMFKKPLYKWVCNTWYRKAKADPSMNWVIATIGIAVAMVFWFVPDIRTSGAYLKADGSIRNVYAVKLFITYAVGTTFHDTIVNQIIGIYKRVSGNTDRDNGETTV